MRKPTIYEVLENKLGRAPTDAECIADVKRILAESADKQLTATKSVKKPRKPRVKYEVCPECEASIPIVYGKMVAHIGSVRTPG